MSAHLSGYHLLPGGRTDGSSLSLNSIRNIDNILIIDARLHLSKCLQESCQQKRLRCACAPHAPAVHAHHACDCVHSSPLERGMGNRDNPSSHIPCNCYPPQDESRLFAPVSPPPPGRFGNWVSNWCGGSYPGHFPINIISTPLPCI